MSKANMVFYPQDTMNNLVSLTRDEREFSCIMLYRPKQVDGHVIDPSQYPKETQLRLMPIEAVIVTARGGNAHVTHRSEQISLLNEFLRLHPKYKYIDGHTHTESLGEHWANNFSGGDLRQYTENARDDPDYFAALITPRKIKYWPDGTAKTIVMDRRRIEAAFGDYAIESASAMQVLHRIARSHGKTVEHRLI